MEPADSGVEQEALGNVCLETMKVRKCHELLCCPPLAMRGRTIVILVLEI